MDSSWIISTENIENKENATTTTSSVYRGGVSMHKSSPSHNNLSFNTYGILTSVTNTNAANNTTFSSFNGNDSFDNEKMFSMKLDVYEKQIQKLVSENQSLRKRVKNLKDLARSKEEQLMEHCSVVVETREKNIEKTQLEYK